jgi:hypothetical protein
MCCLSPITRSRRGQSRELRNSFVARALSRQGSKCRILSVLMGSVFGRDRIRFSCFRYASDEIWTVPWRGATGYFCSKGGLRKMTYPLGARSRFDAKPGIRRKIKPGQTRKVFVFIKEETAECARITHARQENAIIRCNWIARLCFRGSRPHSLTTTLP